MNQGKGPDIIVNILAALKFRDLFFDFLLISASWRSTKKKFAYNYV